MKFYLDTEFIESGPSKPIQLISLGMVCEDGREFYAISSEFNPEDASPWVKENVLATLEPATIVKRRSLHEIKMGMMDFIWNTSIHERPQFWGYYCDYDWVVFCQIFGNMMALPKNFPMYCRDLKQWCDDLRNPDLPAQGKGEHNALTDARWNKQAWEFLSKFERSKAFRAAYSIIHLGTLRNGIQVLGPDEIEKIITEEFS